MTTITACFSSPRSFFTPSAISCLELSYGYDFALAHRLSECIWAINRCTADALEPLDNFPYILDSGIPNTVH
ncbi:hypothetical protein N7471_013737 [Penicillium samsonianum]|uniref:uncharacterized protein n=1 Tax=Penicillium samsonianum TaxID=1882272 RepID=UPI002546AC43|nr:uncharacterized protein N7471_013737 [Penicillium samsonianum]KAJ6118270.1 hypothetical protein N7471_013737 [Penicillium samsonianum]